MSNPRYLAVKKEDLLSWIGLQGWVLILTAAEKYEKGIREWYWFLTSAGTIVQIRTVDDEIIVVSNIVRDFTLNR